MRHILFLQGLLAEQDRKMHPERSPIGLAFDERAPQMIFFQNPHEQLATAQITQPEWLADLQDQLGLQEMQHLLRIILHKAKSFTEAGMYCHNFMGRQLASDKSGKQCCRSCPSLKKRSASVSTSELRPKTLRRSILRPHAGS